MLPQITLQMITCSIAYTRDAPDPEILDPAGTGSKILVGSGFGLYRNRNRTLLTGITGSNRKCIEKIPKWLKKFLIGIKKFKVA